MSYRTPSSRISSSAKASYSRAPSQRKPATPVCPHCRNIGLPFDHWLRESTDPNSPIVCSVLLKTECRYCHEFGHTVSRCPKRNATTTAAGSGVSSSNTERRNHDVPSVLVSPSVCTTNMFSSLGNATDSSDDEEEEGLIKEDKHSFREVVRRSVQASAYNNATEYEYPPNVPRMMRGYADGRDSDYIETTPCDYKEFPALPAMSSLRGLSFQSCNTAEDVDEFLASMRSCFTNGKSWADICNAANDDE